MTRWMEMSDDKVMLLGHEVAGRIIALQAAREIVENRGKATAALASGSTTATWTEIAALANWIVNGNDVVQADPEPTSEDDEAHDEPMRAVQYEGFRGQDPMMMGVQVQRGGFVFPADGPEDDRVVEF